MRAWLLLPLALLLAAALPGAAAAPQSDALEAGRKAFRRCASCHQVGPGARSQFAPHLNGIVGRRAGALPDFAYSPAMKRAGFVWTEARLRAFLADPDKIVPGNKMRFWNIMGERQVGDLAAYLATLPPSGDARR